MRLQADVAIIQLFDIKIDFENFQKKFSNTPTDEVRPRNVLRESNAVKTRLKTGNTVKEWVEASNSVQTVGKELRMVTAGVKMTKSIKTGVRALDVVKAIKPDMISASVKGSKGITMADKPSSIVETGVDSSRRFRNGAGESNSVETSVEASSVNKNVAKMNRKGFVRRRNFSFERRQEVSLTKTGLSNRVVAEGFTRHAQFPEDPAGSPENGGKNESEQSD